jgi:hypothetical protein
MSDKVQVAAEAHTRIWDLLGKTDPKQTKQFQRSGGFRGTAVKPMWSNLRMTEVFVPCGSGWGMGEPRFETREAAGEMLVFCTVSLWYGLESGSRSEPVYGVGGDKYLVEQKSGLRSSDEAFKAAYTDALGNAMKFIGVAADVHMGRFDDNKYVKEMEEFYAPKADPNAPKLISKQEADELRTLCNLAVGKGIDKSAIRDTLQTVGGVFTTGEVTTDKYEAVKAAIGAL